MPGGSARRLPNRLLSPLGLEVVRRREPVRSPLGAVLARARAAGIAPETVIDLGAAYGSWALECSEVFPSALYLLVEPLDEFTEFLEKRTQEIDRAVRVDAAATRQSGPVVLNVHHDLVGSSLLSESEGGALHLESRTIAGIAVDELVREHRARPPFLLKVDVQGAELDALGGAADTLAQTELAIVEVSFLRFFESGAEFYDVVIFMRDRGFAVYDLLGLTYRPLDGALAQADVVFVPDRSPLRAAHVYASPEQRQQQNEAFRAAYERRRRALQA